ncbi:DUF1176 domain-containing protein [Sphingomonas sp.]|uniref:DUF1176 domain-containing protein n=1 Tax=Sphingomonas sp. TaxID=28214 RepID=UPI0035BC8692
MTQPSIAALGTAAALLACSPEPARNAAAPAVRATFAPTEVPARPTAPPKAMVPRPGELKTFGDWTVGCDNTLRCELRSLGPETGALPDVTVSISRNAGPAGKLEVSVDGQDDTPLAVALDGRRADTPARIVAAMANAHALTALAAGKAVATVSLKGASAALRYADAVQGRAGTVTALVARGLKPASAVPAAPAPPTIAALAPGGPAASPTEAQLATMRRAAQCSDKSIAAGTIGAPETYALGGGKTLVLLPCSAGAYNVLAAMFVLDESGVVPVRADAPVGFTASGADSATAVPTVVNGEFRKGVLASYAKGRGIGDCGVAQQFVWDGTRLRLSEQRAMGECRGNTDYITTWRATVVRR